MKRKGRKGREEKEGKRRQKAAENTVASKRSHMQVLVGSFLACFSKEAERLNKSRKWSFDGGSLSLA